MRAINTWGRLTLAVLALAGFIETPAFAQQASITLVNCSNALCNANNTEWSLTKTPTSQTLTGDNTITWTVTATKGETSHNFITVNGFITVKNTGTAPATIGNIVVNLQKPRAGANTGVCKNVGWVSAAADVADANSGDASTTDNIVAAASSEVAGCNASQGGANYTASAAQGTFVETAASGALEFTDADSNTVFSLSPVKTLAPGAQINLLYSATFDNTTLGLAVGSSVRSEVIVTFGNSGARGGSGSSAQDIDIDGNGTLNNLGDEHLVRSVPCRVTTAIPALVNGNATVTLSDSSVSVIPENGGVAVSNFAATNLGDISATTTSDVSVDETCTPPGAAIVNNTAHLDGADAYVTVQGPQIGQNCVTDPSTLKTTCTPVYQQFPFICVTGVALDASANAIVTCEEVPPPPLPDACTYGQGGWGAKPNGNNPGTILANNFGTVYPGGSIEVGIPGSGGYSMTFNTSQDTVCLHKTKGECDQFGTVTVTGPEHIEDYLPAGDTPGALTADLVNPTSSSSGVFGGQVLALQLNVDFDNANIIGTGSPTLGSLVLCNNSTVTVAQILADANTALGGGALPSYVTSIDELKDLVENINGAFEGCSKSKWALENLCVAQ